MTTITSNGYYLIADKRQTSTHTVNQHNSSEGVRSRTVSSHNDHTVKIYANLGDGFTIQGETVVAYAISGSVITGERFMEAAKGLPLEKFIDSYAALTDLRSTADSFSVVMVSESKKTYRIVLGVEVRNNRVARKFNIDGYGSGYVLFEGSGSGLIYRLVKSGSISYSRNIRNQHPLNVHLFMASTDKSSSYTYDVYGVDEGKLVIGLEPSSEAVQEAVDAISAGVKFTVRDK